MSRCDFFSSWFVYSFFFSPLNEFFVLSLVLVLPIFLRFALCNQHTTNPNIFCCLLKKKTSTNAFLLLEIIFDTPMKTFQPKSVHFESFSCHGIQDQKKISYSSDMHHRFHHETIFEIRNEKGCDQKKSDSQRC